MKNVIKLEELAMFALSIYGLISFNSPWWVYLLLLLGPDISMVGYAINEKIGAVCYNIFHQKAVAIIIGGIGIICDSEALIVTGIILFGHSSMDRTLGYGLKYFEGFKFTHLGEIGQKNGSLQ
jgi:hypothetical protein